MMPQKEKAARKLLRDEASRAKLNSGVAPKGVTCAVYGGDRRQSWFCCSLGHFFSALAKNVRAGRTGCPVCAAEADHINRGDKRSEVAMEAALAIAMSDAVVAQAAQTKAAAALRAAADLIAIADVKAAQAKLAPKRRNFGAVAAKQKGGKPRAAGRKPASLRPTGEVLSPKTYETLAALGVTLATPEIAKSSDPTLLRCAEGHEFIASPSRIASAGRGCPVCEGAEQDLACGSCGAISRHQVKRIRREALTVADQTVKYCPPTAPCPSCGAKVAVPARSAKPSDEHLARVEAADVLRKAYAAQKQAGAKQAYDEMVKTKPHLAMFIPMSRSSSKT